MSRTYMGFFSFRNISLTMKATYMILLKSQNHRVILSEGISRGILSNALLKAGLILIRIFRVTSSWVFSISKVGDSTASLFHADIFFFLCQVRISCVPTCVCCLFSDNFISPRRVWVHFLESPTLGNHRRKKTKGKTKLYLTQDFQTVVCFFFFRVFHALYLKTIKLLFMIPLSFVFCFCQLQR